MFFRSSCVNTPLRPVPSCATLPALVAYPTMLPGGWFPTPDKPRDPERD